MKGCHFCAGERMIEKVRIPLDTLLPQGNGEHTAPAVKPIVIVQCPRCMRIEVDSE
jgi:hypothetical protein